MANYGIATDNLPMFLGQECVIEHIRTLRIKNKDIHKDQVLLESSWKNTRAQRQNEFNSKGWIDIANTQLELNGLLAFIGVQANGTKEQPAPLNLIKFRHQNGKTQARIAYSTGIYAPNSIFLYDPEHYVEIFIYRRITQLSPNSGYGIHIYDSNGTLKYKDGLNLLNNLKRYPVNFNLQTDPNARREPFNLNNNRHLMNIGTNKAILQTANLVISNCYKSGEHWYYSGGIYSAYLDKQGNVLFGECDSFQIYSGKQHQYPSYAKGGAYMDNVVTVDHILVIDKPN